MRAGNSFVLLMALLLVGAVPGNTESSGGSIQVESTYLLPSDAGSRETVLWEIKIRKDDKTNTKTFSYFKHGEKDQALCSVTILRNDRGDAHRIEWKGNASPPRESETATFIYPGYPAPCDIIAGGNPLEAPTEAKIKKRIGGRVFIETFTIERETIETIKAIENCWIDNDSRASKQLHESFTLLSVYDADHEFVLRQLWPMAENQNSRWWIYEETPYRRSKRVQ